MIIYFLLADRARRVRATFARFARPHSPAITKQMIIPLRRCLPERSRRRRSRPPPPPPPLPPSPRRDRGGVTGTYF